MSRKIAWLAVVLGCVWLFWLPSDREMARLDDPRSLEPSQLDTEPERPSLEQIASATTSIAVPFVENQGQLPDPRVRFHAETFGGNLAVYEDGRVRYGILGAGDRPLVFEESFGESSLPPAAGDPSVTRVSFFHGRDPEAWRPDVPAFTSVSMGEVGPGIRLDLVAHLDNVEKIFTIDSGASAADIVVRLGGIDALSIGETGELVVDSSGLRASFTRPVAYQEIDGTRREVEVAYALADDDPRGFEYGFEVGEYDAAHPLMIDPLLASSYVGKYSYDYGTGVAVDAAGDIYITGGSKKDSLGRYYPTTEGVYQPVHADDGGNYDVVVSKLDSGLTQLLASTFIGGSSYDLANAMALDDSAGESLVIVGRTSSTDFPVTEGAYDESFNGGSDVFVLRMSPDLTTLEASTYVGGSSSEGAFETNTDRGPVVALDALGNVHVAGTTVSSDFPTTPTDAGYDYAAYQSSHHGDDEAFVFKLARDLDVLLAGTFLGGSKHERGTGIALGASGNVCVTGHTESTDSDSWALAYVFPRTHDAYDRSFNSDGGVLLEDGFVSCFDPNLEWLEGSTFIGGSKFEHVWAIAVDPFDDSVYIGGVSQSSDYPTTPGAFDETSNSGFDGFISKLDADLTMLLASTRLGGAGSTYVQALGVDPNGGVWASGRTSADDFPNFEDPDDPLWSTYANELYFTYDDVFLSHFDDALSELIHSVHMSGSYDQSIWDLVVDWEGYFPPGAEEPTIPAESPVIYLVGTADSGGTGASRFYTFPDAYDRIAHNNDLIVTAFGYVPEPRARLLEIAATLAVALLARGRESVRRLKLTRKAPERSSRAQWRGWEPPRRACRAARPTAR